MHRRTRSLTMGLAVSALAAMAGETQAKPGAAYATPAPNPTLLSYEMPGPLKWNNCSGDTDGDCLHNFYEDDLAWVVSPILFFDEGEECGDGKWAERPFFQVRPNTDSTGRVSQWQAGDGQVKRVVISYYFNWPLDCGHWPEGSHFGDSEHVEFTLSSDDMHTWTVDNVRYFSHGRHYDRTGAWLHDRADEIGADYVTVAVEDDKHGSWWGRAVDDQDCAGSEDDYALGAIDCFPGKDWRDAYNDGDYRWLDITRNIGEPPLMGGNFDTSGFSTGGTILEDASRPGAFYSAFAINGGPGWVKEYWWNPPADYSKFCGYMCPAWDRLADGDCDTRSVHIAYQENRNFSDCASGLQVKVNTSSFDNTSGFSSCGAASEEGTPCMSHVGDCGCDDRCVVREDCCPDKQDLCPFDPYSCEGHCGGMSTIGGCGCDYECMERGDCCENFEVLCPDVEPWQPSGTCSGSCGWDHEDCACDDDCEQRGDCCLDKTDECGWAIDKNPGHCDDFCGGYGGGCHCDEYCMSRGDCCQDFQDEC